MCKFIPHVNDITWWFYVLSLLSIICVSFTLMPVTVVYFHR